MVTSDVELTTNGAVPVATDEVSCPLKLPNVVVIPDTWIGASEKVGSVISIYADTSGSGTYPWKNFQIPSVASLNKPACLYTPSL